MGEPSLVVIYRLFAVYYTRAHTKASILIMLKLRDSTFLHSYIAATTMSS